MRGYKQTICNSLGYNSAHSCCTSPRITETDFTIVMEGTDETKRKYFYKGGKLWGEVVKIKGSEITIKRISDNKYIDGWEQTIVLV